MAAGNIHHFLMQAVQTAVLLVVVVILVIGAGTLVLTQRQSWRARARIADGVTDQSFLSAFPPGSETRSIAMVALRSVQEVAGTSRGRPFPVLPDDSLYRIYGIVDEDLDDLVRIVLRRSGRQWPPANVLTASHPVQTVADLVAFVAACPPSPDRAVEPNRAT